VRQLAEEIGGVPGGALTDAFNVPMTAHILGGAAIGATPADGVVDPYQRVFGHPGLHVADGAAMAANLGVNPSLTITALAERAMSFWPNRGEPDPRPALGSPYERIAPVPPVSPAVPATAPAALRLP
jgi:cholesterol oxidase